VSYRYEWQGGSYASQTFGLDQPAYDDWSKIRRLEKRYPANSRTGCYVNPEAPSQAILELRSFWLVLFLPLPLLFVVIGGGGIYAMWFQSERVRKGIESISAEAPRPQRHWLVPALFAALFAVGTGVFFGFLLRPAWQFAHAAEWNSVPCRIEFSRVGVHEGDDSTTYSADILFGYEVDGVRYRSSRFRFLQASSSDSAGKRDTVRQYPSGTETTCYVNPSDPEEAVLERSFPAAMLLGLIPVLFMLIGGGGLFHQWRTYRSTRPGQQAPPPVGATGPATLNPKMGRWGKLISAVVFTCIWNGILSAFLWQVIESWQRGRFEKMLAIYMVPFVLVGLASIGAVCYFFLGLFNPRMRLELSRATVRAGDSAELAWTLAGKLSAVRRLRITLEGREEITYKKGENNRVEKHVLTEAELFDRHAPLSATPGLARLRVPREAMHTHEGKNNKILWHVCVRGDVRRSPDIDLEFPIRVLPAPVRWEDSAEPASLPSETAASPLRIRILRTRFQPGEVVDGSVEWQLPAAPKKLALRLFWYTAGQGFGDVQISGAVQFESPGASGHRPFRLQLPDTPHSYSGQLFSIHWALELVARPGEETSRVELQMG